MRGYSDSLGDAHVSDLRDALQGFEGRFPRKAGIPVPRHILEGIADILSEYLHPTSHADNRAREKAKRLLLWLEYSL